jgi:hypothetical protein
MKTSDDVINITLSDMHSGSNYALFLDRPWKGNKGQNHYPTSAQLKIRAQMERMTAEMLEARKGKRVVLVHNGDAIDGDHHNSGDVCSVFEQEQADIHCELMAEIQKRIGWRAGDTLYYTKGTDVHGRESEEAIAAEMNAVMDGDFHAWELLTMRTNGRLIWYVHHGPSAGDGANEGNALRNWLRNIYMNAVKNETDIPDIVYTGHVHVPTYAVYTWRRGMEFHPMHGIITPALQDKTKYAWMKAPVQKNWIGGVWQEIKADGTVGVPRFCVI